MSVDTMLEEAPASTPEVTLSPQKIDALRRSFLEKIPRFRPGMIAAVSPVDLRNKINAAITAKMDAVYTLRAYGPGLESAPRATAAPGRKWNVVETSDSIEIDLDGQTYTGWTALMMQEVTTAWSDSTASWLYDDL